MHSFKGTFVVPSTVVERPTAPPTSFRPPSKNCCCAILSSSTPANYNTICAVAARHSGLQSAASVRHFVSPSSNLNASASAISSSAAMLNGNNTSAGVAAAGASAQPCTAAAGRAGNSTDGLFYIMPFLRGYPPAVGATSIPPGVMYYSQDMRQAPEDSSATAATSTNQSAVRELTYAPVHWMTATPSSCFETTADASQWGSSSAATAAVSEENSHPTNGNSSSTDVLPAAPAATGTEEVLFSIQNPTSRNSIEDGDLYNADNFGASYVGGGRPSNAVTADAEPKIDANVCENLEGPEERTPKDEGTRVMTKRDFHPPRRHQSEDGPNLRWLLNESSRNIECERKRRKVPDATEAATRSAVAFSRAAISRAAAARISSGETKREIPADNNSEEVMIMEREEKPSEKLRQTADTIASCASFSHWKDGVPHGGIEQRKEKFTDLTSTNHLQTFLEGENCKPLKSSKGADCEVVTFEKDFATEGDASATMCFSSPNGPASNKLPTKADGAIQKREETCLRNPSRRRSSSSSKGKECGKDQPSKIQYSLHETGGCSEQLSEETLSVLCKEQQQRQQQQFQLQHQHARQRQKQQHVHMQQRQQIQQRQSAKKESSRQTITAPQSPWDVGLEAAVYLAASRPSRASLSSTSTTTTAKSPVAGVSSKEAQWSSNDEASNMYFVCGGRARAAGASPTGRCMPSSNTTQQQGVEYMYPLCNNSEDATATFQSARHPYSVSEYAKKRAMLHDVHEEETRRQSAGASPVIGVEHALNHEVAVTAAAAETTSAAASNCRPSLKDEKALATYTPPCGLISDCIVNRDKMYISGAIISRRDTCSTASPSVVDLSDARAAASFLSPSSATGGSYAESDVVTEVSGVQQQQLQQQSSEGKVYSERLGWSSFQQSCSAPGTAIVRNDSFNNCVPEQQICFVATDLRDQDNAQLREPTSASSENYSATGKYNSNASGATIQSFYNCCPPLGSLASRTESPTRSNFELVCPAFTLAEVDGNDMLHTTQPEVTVRALQPLNPNAPATQTFAREEVCSMPPRNNCTTNRYVSANPSRCYRSLLHQQQQLPSQQILLYANIYECSNGVKPSPPPARSESTERSVTHPPPLKAAALLGLESACEATFVTQNGTAPAAASASAGMNEDALNKPKKQNCATRGFDIAATRTGECCEAVLAQETDNCSAAVEDVEELSEQDPYNTSIPFGDACIESGISKEKNMFGSKRVWHTRERTDAETLAATVADASVAKFSAAKKARVDRDDIEVVDIKEDCSKRNGECSLLAANSCCTLNSPRTNSDSSGDPKVCETSRWTDFLFGEDSDVEDDKSVQWHEGFTLPLGKHGRGELIKRMRSVHKADRDFCRFTLEEMGIDFKRLAHATVEELWRIAYRWGLFTYAVKLSRKYGKTATSTIRRRTFNANSTTTPFAYYSVGSENECK